MTNKSTILSLKPKILARVILVSSSIRILSLVFAPSSYRPDIAYAIGIIVVLLFSAYFLLVLHHKNINTTVLNILMLVLLMIIILLMATAFLGDFSFIIASIGYELWFSSTYTPLIYIMALVFFILLLIMMIGVIKKLSFDYTTLQLVALAIVIVCLVVSLYQYLTIDTIATSPTILLSDISMGVSYMGMALFIGAYGNVIKKNKETKNAKNK